MQRNPCVVDAMLVYDLGMTVRERRPFAAIPGVQVKAVEPFCAHWRQCWTWKPWVWADAARHAERVLYLDAGVEVVGDLGTIFEQLDQNGHFVLNEYFAHPAGHTVEQITPRAYFNELSIDFAIAGRPVISAAVVGFDAGSSFLNAVVPRCLELHIKGYNLGWSSCELSRNRGLHYLDGPPTRDCDLFRHDQTILSVVFHDEVAEPAIQSRDRFPFGENRPTAPAHVLWQLRRDPRLRWVAAIQYAHLALIRNIRNLMIIQSSRREATAGFIQTLLASRGLVGVERRAQKAEATLNRVVSSGSWGVTALRTAKRILRWSRR